MNNWTFFVFFYLTHLLQQQCHIALIISHIVYFKACSPVTSEHAVKTTLNVCFSDTYKRAKGRGVFSLVVLSVQKQKTPQQLLPLILADQYKTFNKEKGGGEGGGGGTTEGGENLPSRGREWRSAEATERLSGAFNPREGAELKKLTDSHTLAHTHREN